MGDGRLGYVWVLGWDEPLEGEYLLCLDSSRKFVLCTPEDDPSITWWLKGGCREPHLILYMTMNGRWIEHSEDEHGRLSFREIPCMLAALYFQVLRAGQMPRQLESWRSAWSIRKTGRERWTLELFPPKEWTHAATTEAATNGRATVDLADRPELVTADHPVRLSLPAPSGNGTAATNGRDIEAPTDRIEQATAKWGADQKNAEKIRSALREMGATDEESSAKEGILRREIRLTEREYKRAIRLLKKENAVRTKPRVGTWLVA